MVWLSCLVGSALRGNTIYENKVPHSGIILCKIRSSEGPLNQLRSLEPKVANDAASSAAIKKAPYWRYSWQRIRCFLNPSPPACLVSCRPTTTIFARAPLKK